ncbi:MAG: antitoxin VapB family protein [Halobacteriales archaeon]
MSKNIAISDEVYEILKREKGDRSFSEVIAAHLESGSRIADVTGQQILTEETYTEIKDEISRQSTGTIERVDDDVA